MPNNHQDPDSQNTSRSAQEPRTVNLGQRDFGGASYGATEREQTRDLRRADPGQPSDDAADTEEDGANADIANDENGE